MWCERADRRTLSSCDSLYNRLPIESTEQQDTGIGLRRPYMLGVHWVCNSCQLHSLTTALLACMVHWMWLGLKHLQRPHSAWQLQRALRLGL